MAELAVEIKARRFIIALSKGTNSVPKYVCEGSAERGGGGVWISA